MAYLEMEFETLADLQWEAKRGLSQFENELWDLIGKDFNNLTTDSYYKSLEVHAIENDARLSEEAQDFIMEAGFEKVYLRHRDGWETHYTLGLYPASKGWRKRWVAAPEEGLPNRGYFEVSYWPESWNKNKEWLEVGYVKIVPDPLEREDYEPETDVEKPHHETWMGNFLFLYGKYRGILGSIWFCLFVLYVFRSELGLDSPWKGILAVGLFITLVIHSIIVSYIDADD